MIREFNDSPIQVGELIELDRSKVESLFYTKEGDFKTYKVLSIEGNEAMVKRHDAGRVEDKSVNLSELEVRRWTFPVGANPFAKSDNVRYVAFSLDSILHSIGFDRGDYGRVDRNIVDGVDVPEANWNPFVKDAEGNKVYYQRPFVWTIEDKQLLIESLYQRMDCGRVLIRLRSWEQIRELIASGESELSFKDIVDGKQRLSAIVSFIQNEYPDLRGNYWADLSDAAQSEFRNLQSIAFAEMSEKTTDAEVIAQFLKLNFAGVPQSKEHIEFVRSINI